MFLYFSDEEIEWAHEIMTGVVAARTAIEAARKPRGTRTNPALSCRDLRTSHANLTDGKSSYHIRISKSVCLCQDEFVVECLRTSGNGSE